MSSALLVAFVVVHHRQKNIGQLDLIAGEDAQTEIKVVNTQFWMDPNTNIASANQGQVRAIGYVWDLEGRGAEISQIDCRG